MNYVDAHLHLADPGLAGQIQQVLDDAEKNNVTCLLSNALDYETSVQTIDLAKRHSPPVIAAIGLHPWIATNRAYAAAAEGVAGIGLRPWTVTNTNGNRLEEFDKLIEQNSECVKAIGEIGLDGKYTQDVTLRENQQNVFRSFLGLAERRRLPVVVHSRLAVDEVLQTLSEYRLTKVLLHWYDGPVDRLRAMREKGYMISIGPAVYYSQAVAEIARHASLDMILTETDAPVRYREPFKGKLTQPSFVVEVVRKLAEIRGLRIEEMRSAVWKNFQEFIPS